MLLLHCCCCVVVADVNDDYFDKLRNMLPWFPFDDGHLALASGIMASWHLPNGILIVTGCPAGEQHCCRGVASSNCQLSLWRKLATSRATTMIMNAFIDLLIVELRW